MQNHYSAGVLYPSYPKEMFDVNGETMKNKYQYGGVYWAIPEILAKNTSELSQQYSISLGNTCLQPLVICFEVETNSYGVHYELITNPRKSSQSYKYYDIHGNLLLSCKDKESLFPIKSAGVPLCTEYSVIFPDDVAPMIIF